MSAGKSSRVNRKYKTKYRIRNWSEYERGLRSGDVTIWLSEEAIAAWTPPMNGLRGGQRRYSNLAILTVLTLRVVFGMPLRQTEEFLDSLLSLMGLNLKAPDHTTLQGGACRRGGRGRHVVSARRRAGSRRRSVQPRHHVRQRRRCAAGSIPSSR